MFIDRFIPDDLMASSADRVRARSLVFFTLSIASAGIATLLYVLIAEQSLPPRRMVSSILIASMLIPIALIRLTHSLKWPGRLTILLAFVTISYVHYNNLALRGPTTVFFILPPMLTALLVGGRATFVVAFSSLAMVIFHFILMKLDQLPPPIMQLENAENIALAASIIIIAVVTSLFYALFNLYRQREADLSEEMTKGQELMKELLQATKEAEASAKSKAMFLATMSHELRTPLNSVIGNATLLSRNDLPEASKANIEDIQLAANLLLTLINDILDISKFETVGVELKPKPYDLAQQLKQLHHMYLSNIAADVIFELKLPSESMVINADQNRIAQISLNFLSNAAKFTEAGKIELGVEVLNQNLLSLYVMDTGKGISEEDQSRLFEEFVQVGDSPRAHQQGTGLGLSIVNRIVTAMGGTLQIQSETGKGTRIEAHLPISIEQINILEKKDKTSSSPGVAEQLYAQKILIVDDVEMNCVVLKALLESLGASQCTTLNGGRKAIDYIDNNPETDIVFMDVRMPDMDGLTATQHMRKKGFKAPIIAVTANAFAEDQTACLDAGMTDFISKPVDIGELARVIELIQKRKAEARGSKSG